MAGQADADHALPEVVIAFIVDLGETGDARIVDDGIKAAAMFCDFGNGFFDVRLVADIEFPGFGFAALGDDGACDLFRAFKRVVGDSDVGAFGGKDFRRGAAHAAGGAGDESGEASYGSAIVSHVSLPFLLSSLRAKQRSNPEAAKENW